MKKTDVSEACGRSHSRPRGRRAKMVRKDGVAEDCIKVYDAIKESPGITLSGLVKHLGKGRSWVEHRLCAMEPLNLLVYEGARGRLYVYEK